MIYEGILRVFFGTLTFLLDRIPVLDPVMIPIDITNGLINLVAGINYFIPVNVIVFALASPFMFYVFMVAWRALLRVKSFVPFWGN